MEIANTESIVFDYDAIKWAKNKYQLYIACLSPNAGYLVDMSNNIRTLIELEALKHGQAPEEFPLLS